jgi:low temperature requirement protein LtrA
MAGHVRRPDAGTAARVAWLERFYDLVFVAAVGRFANELGARPDAAHVVQVLGWLVGLWVAWFLVTMRLNRFPDEGWLCRGIVVGQLLATTVAAAAAISVAQADDALGTWARALMSFGITALYLTVPLDEVRDRKALAVPVVGSAVVGAATLADLVLPPRVAGPLAALAATVLLILVLGWYLPRLARNRPVDPVRAGARHGQLFLVLMGLSFLKVAFATDPRAGVDYLAVVGAFAVGFSLWTMYVDGVLPLGFPLQPSRQRTWLVAQLVLALGVTVAASAVVAVPPTSAGRVTVTGALLEGGAFLTVLAALGVLAAASERPARHLAVVRWSAAVVVGLLALLAVPLGLPDDVFLSALGGVVVLAALTETRVGSQRAAEDGPHAEGARTTSVRAPFAAASTPPVDRPPATRVRRRRRRAPPPSGS